MGSSPKAPKPQKVKATAHEKELGRQASQRYGRYMSQYAPLEDKMVSNINRPTERLIEGRSNADIMREASMATTSSIEAGGIATGLNALEGVNRALARSGSDTAFSSTMGSRAMTDDRAMATIETGLGISGRQAASMSNLASMSNQQALSRFENENRVNLARVQADDQRRNARTSATLGVLGSAAGGAMGRYNTNQQASRIDQIYRAPALNSFDEYGR